MANIELLTKEREKERVTLTADQVKEAIHQLERQHRSLSPGRERYEALSAKLMELFGNCQSFDHDALAYVEHWTGQKVRGEYSYGSLIPD